MSAKDTCEPTPKTIPASDGWVEVFGDNGAHYRAHVVDVMDGQRLNGGHQAMGSAVREAPQLTLAFESNWHKMETFPVTRVRLPPMTTTTAADTTNRADYTIGQAVEVLTTAQEGEHPGLWKALIKDVKGDFFVVSYAANASNDGKGGDAQTNHMSDIVTKEQIRPMNTNPYLKTSPFFKFVVKVPKELVDMNAAMVQRSQTHQHFRTALSLVSVTFVDHMNILVCVGFAAEPTEHLRSIVEKRALLLADIHFRCLRQSFQLMANVKALRDQRDSLDDVIKHNDNGFEMYVEVEQHLIGLAIGSKGSNLKRVLTTPGVVSITHKDGVFHVIGSEMQCFYVGHDLHQKVEQLEESANYFFGDKEQRMYFGPILQVINSSTYGRVKANKIVFFAESPMNSDDMFEPKRPNQVGVTVGAGNDKNGSENAILLVSKNGSVFVRAGGYLIFDVPIVLIKSTGDYLTVNTGADYNRVKLKNGFHVILYIDLKGVSLPVLMIRPGKGVQKITPSDLFESSDPTNRITVDKELSDKDLIVERIVINDDSDDKYVPKYIFDWIKSKGYVIERGGEGEGALGIGPSSVVRRGTRVKDNKLIAAKIIVCETSELKERKRKPPPELYIAKNYNSNTVSIIRQLVVMMAFFSLFLVTATSAPNATQVSINSSTLSSTLSYENQTVNSSNKTTPSTANPGVTRHQVTDIMPDNESSNTMNGQKWGFALIVYIVVFVVVVTVVVTIIMAIVWMAIFIRVRLICRTVGVDRNHFALLVRECRSALIRTRSHFADNRWCITKLIVPRPTVRRSSPIFIEQFANDLLINIQINDEDPPVVLIRVGPFADNNGDGFAANIRFNWFICLKVSEFNIKIVSNTHIGPLTFPIPAAQLVDTFPDV